MIVVLAASYAFGWFTLFSDEFKQLGKHIAAGTGFVSNFVLWKEAGYFDHSGETKPLLHLWSLAIEEQFYLVWPIFLWVAWTRKGVALCGTLLLGLLSLGLNLKGVSRDASATFYLPQTRFWELLVGSILAWLNYFELDCVRLRKPFSSFLALAGFIILIFGFFRINEQLPYPGKWALIPTLGTAMIILAGANASLNRILLSHPVAVWIGLISFPLYLWHWPIFSFLRILEVGDPSVDLRLYAILLSVILAWITYRLIECPIRFEKKNMLLVPTLVLVMITFFCIGYATDAKDGFGFRTKDKENFISYFENSFPDWNYFKRINLATQWRSECAFFNSRKYMEKGKLEDGVKDSKPLSKIDPSCYLRNPKFDKSVFVWGDSHAQSLSSGLLEFLPKNWQVLQIASSACPANPNITVSSDTSQCDQSNFFAMKTIREAKPNVVVIAQRTNHSFPVMAEIADKLKGLGVEKILFLGPTPQWKSDLPKIFARRLWNNRPKRTYIGINHEAIQANQRLLKDFSGFKKAEYVDVIDLFCNLEGCLIYSDETITESITSWDQEHLTPSASKYLARNLLVERIVTSKKTQRDFSVID